MMINISQTPEILRNNMEILVLRAFQLTETQTRSLALSHALSLSCSLALFSLTLCPPISLFLTHTRFCYPLQKLWKSSLSQNALRQYNPLTRLILSLPTSAIKTTTTTTIIIIIKTNLWNNHPTNQATNHIKKTIQSRYVFLGLYQGNFAHTESFAWPQLLMAERAWNESSTNAGQGKAFVCVRPHTVDAHCYLWQEHPNSIRNAFYFS